jgi:thiol-disulfide isomerase/thioredoxin
MKTKNSLLTVTALFLFIIKMLPVSAQTDSAWGVGDRAPELKIERWLKKGGFPVLQKGKVYLIDLWATWCVPCIACMPHLSNLQHQYKDQGLEVIGITSNDSYGNTLDNATAFIKTRNDIMNYNVAWVPASSGKDLTGIFVHPWMQKAGTMNLPTAFLVDRAGNIAYIGDPHAIDEALEAVMADRHDIKKLRANYLSGLAAEKTCRLFEVAIKENELDKALMLGKKILNDFSFVKANTLLIVGSSIGTLAHTSNVSAELLEIGLSAAQKGVVATQFESPGFLSTLASLYASKKDYVQAIITQSMAISLSEGGMREKQLEELAQYKKMLK